MTEGPRKSGHPAAAGKRAEVFELARQLFPEARQRVRVGAHGVEVVADLLMPEGDGLRLIKVQAGTRVRPRHWDDLALQVWVLRGSGLNIVRAGVLHLDRKHRHGQPSPPLFRWMERELRPDFSDERALLADVQAAAEKPEGSFGTACRVPRPCPWWGRCHPPSLPTDIRQVPGCAALADQLESWGVRSVHELDDAVRLNPLQRRAVRCLRANEDELDPALGPLLPDLEGAHYLDFEAWNPALPRFANTQPYATLPVQWSLHSHEGGTLAHREWLHEDDSDPRPAFQQSLHALREVAGPILVWSPFEARMLRSHGLMDVASRVVDLQALMHRHYYNPGFGPTLSLKRVFSVLCPGEGYSDLDIQDGGMAAVLYQQFLDGETALRPALLAYCARDTWALAQVHRALVARCG